MRMMYHHANTQPQAPSVLNPLLSKDIDTVILTALAKKPEERFQSISAFGRALEQGAQYTNASTSLPVLALASFTFKETTE